ncbi:metal ABC transporter solute-binding protein, Zn/Mn family [Caldalkalibacillus salinus]|uniref:metal ABC transporter solute-binding protein, Zn/Mn family n=1 Tax=Caldalkalibacillus salinus TaxID=2803787 RepID=UPI001922C37D|nr:zinc ABC transporter substrate-binding protein [Caldalkalibacillus salinus]
MRGRILWLSFVVMAVMALTACSLGEEIEKEKVHVVSSFSVLHDIVSKVGGERVKADFLAPLGEDPHEFEPTPGTFRLMAEADIIFYNGYNLDYWIQGLARNAETQAKEVTLTDGVASIPLSEEAGDLSGAEDPHAWLDPNAVIIYAENVAQALIEQDPEGADYYQSQLDAYIEELEDLDQWIEEQVALIPEEHRFIVTSESAFKYFARAYGFEYDAIWEINAHEEGSPQQMSRLIEKIIDRQIPAVFLETSVDARPMERVAQDAGVDIGGRVFTDSLGTEGSNAVTYKDMMTHNVTVIVEGLRQQ